MDVTSARESEIEQLQPEKGARRRREWFSASVLQWLTGRPAYRAAAAFVDETRKDCIWNEIILAKRNSNVVSRNQALRLSSSLRPLSSYSSTVHSVLLHVVSYQASSLQPPVSRPHSAKCQHVRPLETVPVSRVSTRVRPLTRTSRRSCQAGAEDTNADYCSPAGVTGLTAEHPCLCSPTLTTDELERLTSLAWPPLSRLLRDRTRFHA